MSSNGDAGKAFQVQKLEELQVCIRYSGGLTPGEAGRFAVVVGGEGGPTPQQRHAGPRRAAQHGAAACLWLLVAVNWSGRARTVAGLPQLSMGAGHMPSC